MLLIMNFVITLVDYNVMTKFIVNNRADALKTDTNLFFTITNCRIAGSRSLTCRMNYKFCSLLGDKSQLLQFLTHSLCNTQFMSWAN